jgi:hypothetical protein
MNYVVISMFTANTLYEQISENLRSSLEKFKIAYEIFKKPDLGTWEKNCQQKALVIKDALLFYKQPVVWIDADAIVNANPILFESLDCDVAYHKLRTELLSGTLFLNYNPHVLMLIEEWIQLNKKDETAWDQKTLAQLVANKFSYLRYSLLPTEYCKIFDNKKQSCQNPVITHYQASRHYKTQKGKK